MDNFSNTSNDAGLDASGIIAYHVLFMVLITIPMIITNFIIIYAFLVEKAISKPIRIVLINTPIACNIVAIGLFVNQVLVLIGSTNEITPPEELCQFIVLSHRMGGMYRLSFMALYSITVFLIVRLKAATLKPVYMIIAVASIWLFVCLFGVWYLFAFDHLFGKVSCVPMPRGGAGIAFTVVYSLMFALLCFSITLTIPFITMQYIKKNTITKDSKIALALAKFALFLLIGNSINVFSEILPAILAATVVGNTSASTLGGISMAVLAVLVLSLIPPPVLILVYFKDIRNRAFPFLKRKSVTTSTTDTSTRKPWQTDDSNS